ncbi:hypothetical protein RBB50_003465 [Rhinocladiella similis]
MIEEGDPCIMMSPIREGEEEYACVDTANIPRLAGSVSAKKQTTRGGMMSMTMASMSIATTVEIEVEAESGVAEAGVDFDLGCEEEKGLGDERDHAQRSRVGANRLIQAAGQHTTITTNG